MGGHAGAVAVVPHFDLFGGDRRLREQADADRAADADIAADEAAGRRLDRGAVQLPVEERGGGARGGGQAGGGEKTKGGAPGATAPAVGGMPAGGASRAPSCRIRSRGRL